MRLLYLVTEDWYFWSHRLPLARAARDAGFEVLVATAPGKLRAQIEAEGLRYFPLQMRRRPRNPWRYFAAVRELTRLYRRERPDVVHHVSMLPVLTGSIAARRAGIRTIVNTVTGLGHVFLAEGWAGRTRRALVERVYRQCLASGPSRVVFQNQDDLELFVRRRLARAEQCMVIPGSGVDTERFVPTPEPADDPMVLYIGRMLWSKGLRELAAAGRILKQRGLSFRLVFAGMRDQANPACLSEDEIRAWEREGLLDWLGQVDDVAPLLRASAIVCLPSYREGLPLSLLEAAASGRPLIATDVPGCRDVVHPGENGLLVRPRSASALAEALQPLLLDRGARERMGAAGRRLAVERFSLATVVAQTLALYPSACA